VKDRNTGITPSPWLSDVVGRRSS